MKILQMSIYAAVLIGIIFLIRLIFINKIPQKTFVLLWGIVVCRLLIPFSLPSRFSIYSLLPDEIGILSGNLSSIIETNFIESLPGSLIRFPGQIIGPNLLRRPDFWITTSIVGALFLLYIFLIFYFENMKKFKESLPAENVHIEKLIKRNNFGRKFEVRISEEIESPLTYGVFRPIILLPKSMNLRDEESLNYVLLHEMMHIKKFDLLKKAILALALCLHWFNPLAWAMYLLANRDIEISCDESVVRKIGSEFKGSYALTLVSMAERKSALNALNPGFSRYAVKERILSIMKKKRMSFWGTILTFILVLSTTAVFATTKEMDFLRVETILPAISSEEVSIEWNRLFEYGVNLSFYTKNEELFIDNFYNLYQIETLKNVLPQITEVYSVGFKLDDNFDYIQAVRMNYDGDWINEAEFSAKYPGYTFRCFYPVLNSYIKFLKANLIKVAYGYYVSPEYYEKALQIVGKN